MQDIFTKIYLNIITQMNEVPRTGLGLDSFPDADPEVIADILKHLNRNDFAQNYQILRIIAHDYWVKLDYRKYINNSNYDDLKSTVAGCVYKHMQEFNNIIKGE